MKKILMLLYKIILKKMPLSNNSFFRKLRYNVCKKIIRKCGKNVNFDRNCVFNYDLEIGDNSGIGENSKIEKNVLIGDNVMMGPDCLIYTRNHKYNELNIPIIRQGFDEYKKVTIEDDVWIGARVIILPGVTIKRGCVIGAGSIVTKDTEEYSVYGGNPAKKIKGRSDE